MNIIFDNIIPIAAICIIAISTSFIIQHGIVRGIIGAVFRTIWLVPVFCAFFPKSIQESLPRSVKTRPIHILVDDSESMKRVDSGIPDKVEKIVESLQKNCESLGCRLEMTRLSELQPATAKGFSPLGDALNSWSFSVGADPWGFISDGGDWRPSLDWNPKLASLAGANEGGNSQPTHRGIIFGLSELDESNIWVQSVDSPPFSFEGQPFQLSLAIARSPERLGSEQVVQIQIMLEDQSLASINARFDENTEQISVPIGVPSLARGQQLLNVKILPTPEENSLWDNDAFVNIEVLPNTIGLLHLLGSPSWGGRFLRRYLKAEPKYDLISFFILRDRMDNQAVSERELSLIPFPVERLFRDELPNFKVVIIQNFAVFDFLEEENQKRLVEFVKNGGGLLFLGGPRALQPGDLGSSVLGSILPFDVPDNIKRNAAMSQNPFFRNVISKEGPYYDENLEFDIKLANPDPEKRSLANVYESWEKVSSVFSELGTLKGMHRTDQVKFKKDAITPLLEGVTPDGKSFPLAVASYPEKGRAIWLFTDQIWRLAMSDTNKISRSRYHEFIQGAMSWLLRKEFRQPLIVKYFDIEQTGADTIRWTGGIHGPAARYIQSNSTWDIDVCGVKVPLDSVGIEQLGSEDFQISGTLNMKVAGGQRCRLNITGENQAFGSLKTGITTVVPETFSDSQLSSSRSKLQKLAQLTKAKLVVSESDIENHSSEWLTSLMADGGVVLPQRYKTSLDYYWILKEWWIWLLFLALPMEVLVRRWPQIFSDYFASWSKN